MTSFAISSALRMPDIPLSNPSVDGRWIIAQERHAHQPKVATAQ